MAIRVFGLRRTMVRCVLAFILLGWSWAPVLALELVSLERDEQVLHVEGKLITEAQDGGLLVLARDGLLWAIEPDELVKRSRDNRPFEPLSAEKLADQLRGELPDGFDIHQTAHYLICYNTTRGYAQWCGALYERLYQVFINFWSRKGLELHEPEMPLVVLVFADASSYRKFARDELGDAVDSIVAYYSLRTNRVSMYDLTGIQALRRRGDRRGSTAEINRMLSQPAAEPMVATIIHEATHQIAFNCGLHQRYSDVPLWVSEGIAVFFETPDLSSSRGWRGVGNVNRPRAAAFKKSLARRDAGAMAGLLADDKRMRNVATAANAYAEAWALTYYLINRRSDDFVEYLKMLAEKRPFIWSEPEERLKEFQTHFGDNLRDLEADFVRNMQQVR